MESSTLPQNIESPVTAANDSSTFQMCSHIPGIVSYDTSVGLSKFSSSYGGIHGYIAVAVCLFGVLSNFAIIIVLTRKNMLSSTNTLLLWLAVSDLLTMLSYLPFAIHFYIMEPQDPSRMPFSTPEFPWICFLLFHASFSIVCHSIAIWLTIALAIFRYLYICKPTKGAFYCSQQRARLVIALVTFLTMVICIPNAFVNTFKVHHENTTLDIADNGGYSPNGTSLNSSKRIVMTPYYYPWLRDSTRFETTVIQINNWIQAILIKLVPCGMLTTLTLLLVHAMHKAYRKRMKLKSQGKKAESDKHGEHNRVTGMLLAVVVLFTLTELPQGILTLMNIFIACFYDVVYSKLGDLLDIMALTNNSINFVLYCTMSTQFRNTFSSIFCPSRPSRPKWLGMKIVNKSRHEKNSIETSNGEKRDKKKQMSKRKVNDRDAEEGRGGPVAKEVHGNSNNMMANDIPETGDSGNSKTDSERLLISQDHSDADGNVSHTHGFSSDQTHL